MWRALDHTADACLVVEAASWPELLAEAVAAFAGWTSSDALPAPDEERRVDVSGVDATETWVHLWRALHRLWVVEGLLPVRAVVEPGASERAARVLVRCVSADRVDPERLIDVKAVTWHRAEAARLPGDGWRGTIVLDI